MKVLFTEKQIENKICELSVLISNNYSNSLPVLIGVLNGSVFFLSDLSKKLYIDCQIDFCRVKSYSGNKKGELFFTKKWELDLHNRDVIIVEDLVDSGETVDFLLREIKKEYPNSVSVCSLLYKKLIFSLVDYGGFLIKDNEYVFGYGMDDKELKRNVPFIYIN